MLRHTTVMSVTTNPVLFGRYEVLQTLGQGNFGQVVLVLDTILDVEVAIKLLNDPNQVLEEARVLAGLREIRNVLPIYHAASELGQGYIVTAVARGGTVGDRIGPSGGTGIAPTEAIRWLKQACNGISRVHDQGLVHNDIKPTNLFFDETDEVLVGDFGLAALVNDDGLATPRGTLETMAPEVAQAMLAGNPRGSSFASDVYSLGASLYWMLAGEPPISLPKGTTQIDAFVAIASEARVSLRDVAPHVSQQLATRVAKAMSFAPDDRYPNVSAFAADLAFRSTSRRLWYRTNEDPGHRGCWRGDTRGAASILVCAIPTGSGEIDVVASKMPSRRTVRGVSGRARPRALPALLRKTFAQLDR
jgi:serine/threonine protein kinase